MIARSPCRGAARATRGHRDRRRSASTTFDKRRGDRFRKACWPSRIVPARSLWDSVALALVDSVLVLDAVQDPGNVGTMLRSAAALGVSATVALPGPLTCGTRKSSVAGWALTSHIRRSRRPGRARPMAVGPRRALSGGRGPGTPLPEIKAAAPDRARRHRRQRGRQASRQRLGDGPIVWSRCRSSGVESLNVAVAAGILLYELRA